jgi:hypothetical protein
MRTGVLLEPMHQRRHGWLPILATATGCAVALAACGSSGGDPATSPAKSFSQAVKFSECMRAHGVPQFPDPTANGQGIQIKISSGMNPFSPAWKAAQAVCRKYLPGGGFGPGGHPSAQARAHLLQISECMRAHGISGFPDPTLRPPSGPPGPNSLVLGEGGVFLEVPSTINVRSPAFTAAATACHFGGPGGH